LPMRVNGVANMIDPRMVRGILLKEPTCAWHALVDENAGRGRGSPPWSRWWER